MTSGKTNFVQVDRELKFDIGNELQALQPGEEQIDLIPKIEDTKGSNGEEGFLRVTNLRLLWISKENDETNISMGHNCIKDLYIRNANSVLKGNAQSLYVVTKYEGNKYEFIFTNFGADSPRLFTTAQTVVRAYETSRTYRDLRLRGSIIREGELRPLRGEKVISKVPGVWNISNTQGHLGTMHTTNIRVVWHANLTPNFNVSIPYVQIANVSARQGKMGMTLVIETCRHAGSYVLGFRIEPPERLNALATEIGQLKTLFLQRPSYGVEYVVDDKEKPNELVPVMRSEDTFHIQSDETPDVLGSYYVEVAQQRDRAVVYNPDLGLAIESLPEGYTLDGIWNDLADTTTAVLQQLARAGTGE
ncbi:MAG: hypothetical protein EZS28_012161 [Streblomastix strix]|uniref:BBSome complex member BBS5 PH domain-containing protein n=1 Tax=Streblomastix strix TaxID=222440 RepID=A0A5J4WCM3_9EUKA|nr:MAG: hypothetical protein EZS28_012161 [Streblomastix strix]